MKSCKNCGIAINISEETVECFKFGKKAVVEVTDESCMHHIEIK